jgi:hypothetical protein
MSSQATTPVSSPTMPASTSCRPSREGSSGGRRSKRHVTPLRPCCPARTAAHGRRVMRRMRGGHRGPPCPVAVSWPPIRPADRGGGSSERASSHIPAPGWIGRRDGGSPVSLEGRHASHGGDGPTRPAVLRSAVVASPCSARPSSPDGLLPSSAIRGPDGTRSLSSRWPTRPPTSPTRCGSTRPWPTSPPTAGRVASPRSRRSHCPCWSRSDVALALGRPRVERSARAAATHARSGAAGRGRDRGVVAAHRARAAPGHRVGRRRPGRRWGFRTRSVPGWALDHAFVVGGARCCSARLAALLVVALVRRRPRDWPHAARPARRRRSARAPPPSARRPPGAAADRAAARTAAPRRGRWRSSPAATSTSRCSSARRAADHPAQRRGDRPRPDARIVLHDTLLELEPRAVAAIAAHELAHFERRDPLRAALAPVPLVAAGVVLRRRIDRRRGRHRGAVRRRSGRSSRRRARARARAAATPLSRPSRAPSSTAPTSGPSR